LVSQTLCLSVKGPKLGVEVFLELFDGCRLALWNMSISSIRSIRSIRVRKNRNKRAKEVVCVVGEFPLELDQSRKAHTSHPSHMGAFLSH
jgi:hypothetical protein